MRIKGKALSPQAKHGTRGNGNQYAFLYADLGCEPVNRAERRRQAKRLKRARRNAGTG